jgi:hypothetical protein
MGNKIHALSCCTNGGIPTRPTTTKVDRQHRGEGKDAVVKKKEAMVLLLDIVVLFTAHGRVSPLRGPRERAVTPKESQRV